MLYGLIEGKISPVEVSLLEKTLTAPTSYEVGFLGRGLAPPLVLLLKGQPKTDIQNGRTGRRSIPTAATAWYPIPGTLLPYTEPTLRCPATQVSERNLPHRFLKGTYKQGRRAEFGGGARLTTPLSKVDTYHICRRVRRTPDYRAGDILGRLPDAHTAG